MNETKLFIVKMLILKNLFLMSYPHFLFILHRFVDFIPVSFCGVHNFFNNDWNQPFSMYDTPVLHSWARVIHRHFAESTNSALSFSWLLLILFGENHDGQIEMRHEAKYYDGKNYNDVVTSFESMGFSDISTESLDDLVTGWINKDGTVETVSVSGDDDFEAYEWYPEDSKIVIYFHSFPEKDSE